MPGRWTAVPPTGLALHEAKEQSASEATWCSLRLELPALSRLRGVVVSPAIGPHGRRSSQTTPTAAPAQTQR